jgi:hypothetical protein
MNPVSQPESNPSGTPPTSNELQPLLTDSTSTPNQSSLSDPSQTTNLTLDPNDPFAPDAPIHVLLSLRNNPRIATATDEQIREFVIRMKQIATSAPTMAAKLASDSERIKPKNTVTAKRRAVLDEL